MEEYRHVPRGQTELLGDAAGRDSLDHAQRNDMALDLTQLAHATEKREVILGHRDQLVGSRLITRQSLGDLHSIMRQRAMVSSPLIACCIAHEHGHQPFRIFSITHRQ